MKSRRKNYEQRNQLYLQPNPSGSAEEEILSLQKHGIRYIDHKDAEFLLKFVNEQGKILPRRITGTSLKYQRKISVAIKRARHLALLPFLADGLK